RFRYGAVCNRKLRAAAFQFPRQTTSGNSLADDKDVHDRWIKNRKIPEMKEESGGVAVPLPPEERRAAGVPSPAAP
ncbi:MAG TPA: hypothetical protein DC033_03265, partial [Akkermansia muciniphila]|nr:hypothetical protein [Akkermansia muciniphila]